MDYSDVFVIDNGAYSIKANAISAGKPRLIPNCIMKAKSEKRRPFIGNQIEDCRDASGLFYILGFQKGYVVNWELQKNVWDYTLSDECCKLNLKDQSVIVTEPQFNFTSNRDAVSEIFFEDYECRNIFQVTATDLSVSKYHAEKKDVLCCLVVDSGYSFTHIVPYANGKKIPEGIIRIDIGGKILTNHLKEVISYRQLHVMDETYVINQIKEDVCFVSTNFHEDMEIAHKRGKDNTIARDYILPDFTTVRRGYSLKLDEPKPSQTDQQILRISNERFTIPELLFHPSDVGIMQMGISEAIVEAVNRCPPETHPYLYDNIVLTGGNMKFPGIKDRIYSDVRSAISDDYDLSVFLPSDPETYAWEAGAAFSVDENSINFISTRDEYEENGSATNNGDKFDT